MPACEYGAPAAHGAIVDEELGGDAVGGVDDEVGAGEQVGAGCRRVERGRRGSRSRSAGKRAAQRAAADSTLGCADGAGAVQDLAVQVGELDPVGVDQRPGCRLRPPARRSAAGQPSAPTPTTSTRAAARRSRRVRRLRRARSFMRQKKASVPHGAEARTDVALALSPRGQCLPAGISTCFPIGAGNGCCGFIGPVPQPLWIRYRVKIFSAVRSKPASRALSTSQSSTAVERSQPHGPVQMTWWAVKFR